MITASTDFTKDPPELTVVSDKRAVDVLVSTAGENVTAIGAYPITIVDDSGKVWKPKTDDRTTAIFTL